MLWKINAIFHWKVVGDEGGGILASSTLGGIEAPALYTVHNPLLRHCCTACSIVKYGLDETLPTSRNNQSVGDLRQ